jgi:hypothetical protein
MATGRRSDCHPTLQRYDALDRPGSGATREAPCGCARPIPPRRHDSSPRPARPARRRAPRRGLPPTSRARGRTPTADPTSTCPTARTPGTRRRRAAGLDPRGRATRPHVVGPARMGPRPDGAMVDASGRCPQHGQAQPSTPRSCPTGPSVPTSPIRHIERTPEPWPSDRGIGDRHLAGLPIVPVARSLSGLVCKFVRGQGRCSDQALGSAR